MTQRKRMLELVRKQGERDSRSVELDSVRNGGGQLTDRFFDPVVSTAPCSSSINKHLNQKPTASLMSFFENTKMDAHIVEPFDEDEELDYLGPVDEELEDEREILRWDEGREILCARVQSSARSSVAKSV